MKAKVMKRAHELAKKMIGDWYARLSLALRQAWKEVKNMAGKIKVVLGSKLDANAKSGTIEEFIAAAEFSTKNTGFCDGPEGIAKYSDEVLQHELEWASRENVKTASVKALMAEAQKRGWEVV